MVKRLTVYTFSFTTDWFQVVNAVAAISAAAAAPTRAARSPPPPKRRMRCATRNQSAAEPAPIRALNRLTRTATESPVGARSSSQARASRTKSGLPGGWGMPRMCAVAMYSLVSQNAVVGASVSA